jgi:ADP-heptose:LPS heptosyltransferase
MSEAYAVILGVDLKHELHPPMGWAKIKEELPRTFFAISPFSKSCSRHTGETPNKTLDDFKWEYLIRFLRRQGLPVKVIAGPGDILTKCSVPLNDYFTAKNLYELEYFLKSCKLLISLDNGLGHIASVLDTPMISLWPKVSCHQFIAPRFSAKTAFVLMEPNTSTPSQLLTGIRMFAKKLLGDIDETETTTIQLEDESEVSTESA